MLRVPYLSMRYWTMTSRGTASSGLMYLDDDDVDDDDDDDDETILWPDVWSRCCRSLDKL